MKYPFNLSGIVLILCVIFQPAIVIAEAKIHLVTPVFEGWTNKDGTGFYLELVNMIYQAKGYSIKVEYLPFKRCKLLVSNGKADMMFSLYDRGEGNAIITSKIPVELGRVVVIFSNDEPWDGPQSLDGRLVAVPRGYRFTEELSFSPISVEVRDNDAGIKMFLRGRVPFFYTNRDEMLLTISKRNVDMTKYRIEPVYEKTLHMGYFSSEKGRRLRKIFDEAMPKLIESGELKRLTLNGIMFRKLILVPWMTVNSEY